MGTLSIVPRKGTLRNISKSELFPADDGTRQRQHFLETSPQPGEPFRGTIDKVSGFFWVTLFGGGGSSTFPHRDTRGGTQGRFKGRLEKSVRATGPWWCRH